VEIGERDPIHAHLGGRFMVQTKEVSSSYVCTKFEGDSSICSKVIRGPKISKLGHVTLSHASVVP